MTRRPHHGPGLPQRTPNGVPTSGIDFQEILSRVTIRDILASAGLTPSGNRMACPIHDGDNPTSFSFTETAFICFSCGAKGGLSRLAQALYGCDRNEALRQLCQLAGLPYNERHSANRKHCKSKPRKGLPLAYGVEYFDARDRLEWLELTRHGLNVALHILRRTGKAGKVALPDFFAKEQLYLYQLDELDLHIAAMKYELNRLKRKATPSDKHTSKCN